MWLSTAISVCAMWAGLTTSYLVPRIPPSFAVIALAATAYLAAVAWPALTRRRPGGREQRRTTGPVHRPTVGDVSVV
jgi:zinc/manganese transport system permease protein